MTNAQPEITRVARFPNAPSGARAPQSAGDPNGLVEWLTSCRQETVRQLEAWRAPTLPDEVLEALATIFLMQDHRLTPFFVWLDERVRR